MKQLEHIMGKNKSVVCQKCYHVMRNDVLKRHMKLHEKQPSEYNILIYTAKHLVILTRPVVLDSQRCEFFTWSSHHWGALCRSHHSSRKGRGYLLWSSSPAAIRERSPLTPSRPAHVDWSHFSLIFFHGLHTLFHPSPERNLVTKVLKILSVCWIFQ